MSQIQVAIKKGVGTVATGGALLLAWLTDLPGHVTRTYPAVSENTVRTVLVAAAIIIVLGILVPWRYYGYCWHQLVRLLNWFYSRLTSGRRRSFAFCACLLILGAVVMASGISASHAETTGKTWAWAALAGVTCFVFTGLVALAMKPIPATATGPANGVAPAIQPSDIIDAVIADRDATIQELRGENERLAEQIAEQEAAESPPLGRALEEYEVALVAAKADNPAGWASNAVTAGLSVLSNRAPRPVTSDAELEAWMADYEAEVFVVGKMVSMYTDGNESAILRPDEPDALYEGKHYQGNFNATHNKALNRIAFYKLRLQRLLERAQRNEKQEDDAVAGLKAIKTEKEVQESFAQYLANAKVDITADPHEHERRAAKALAACIALMEARRDAPATSKEELGDWLMRYRFESRIVLRSVHGSGVGYYAWKLPDTSAARMTMNLEGQRDAELGAIETILATLRRLLDQLIGQAAPKADADK